MTLPKVIGPDGKISPAYIAEQFIGARRLCPDCGRPQHYTGTEMGWCHDALTAMWDCAGERVRANKTSEAGA